MTDTTRQAKHSGKNWEYFGAKQHVRDAGLQVLRIECPAKTMAETRYLVRYYDCGGTEILSHARIRKREIAKSQSCMQCNYASAERKAAAKEAMRRARGLKEAVFASGYHGWAPPCTRGE